MAANVVFDHLGHQAVHRTSYRGNYLKHLGTADLVLEGARVGSPELGQFSPVGI